MSDPGELDVLFSYEEYKEYLGEQEVDGHDDDMQDEEEE